jgi:hypothetical protein
VIANKKKSEEHKKEQIAKGSWSGRLMNSLTPEEEKKVANDNKIVADKARLAKQVKYAKIQEEKKLKHEQWEIKYPGYMTRKFGEFWPFFVYNTSYDYVKIAEPLRIAERDTFRTYLADKYGDNWLSDVYDSVDYCEYVGEMVDEIIESMEKATVEHTKEILIEKKKLETELSAEELQAHIDISTNEFMAERGMSDESDWKTQKKKKKTEEVLSDI